MSNKNDLDELLGEDKKEVKNDKKPIEFKPGVGCDIGTSNIVVSRQSKDGTFVNKFYRNMLYPLDVSDESVDLLERSSYLYVKVDNKYYVVGDDALKLVNAIGKGEVVRPMKNGLLNPSLKESSELLFYIIKAVVGNPIVKNESLRFSLPANPIDQSIDNTFHKMLLNNFFIKLGYDAKPLNEAMAICYDCNPIMKSAEGDIPLSGISCSTGAGMFNQALSFKGLSLIEFSCTKSGDNLDEQVSKVTGVPIGKIIRIKERELNLEKIDMSDRVQAALSIYYDEMLDRMVHHICNEFKAKSSEMDGQIEIVIAGGTSMAPGFCNRLEQAIKRVDMPFKIYRIRHSENPFFSVSQGLCLRALADQKKKEAK